MWGLLAAVPMRLCIFHTQAHTLSSIYACVYLYIEIYNTYVHFDTRKDMFYFIISKYFTRFSHRFLFRLSHLLGAHESDGNLTECLTSRPINFITLISLFYKICTFITEAIGIHIHAYMYVCMHACVCTYVYVCMPARVYEFFGTEKPNFPFTRR